MTVQTFAVTIGVLYVLVGLLGFFPGMLTAPPAEAPGVSIHTNYGYLMGLFPVNVLHNLVHLGIGLWGVSAYRTAAASVSFARGLAVFYGVLAVMGLFPVLNTTFGLIPIFGHDIWLHALTAGVAAYFGYGRTGSGVSMEHATRRAS